jgi:signal peptidase I
MEPAIASGSDVIGDAAYYSTHRPARWDVIAFSLANSTGSFVKRIIGLPGETIHLTTKGLIINGAIVAIPPALKRFSCFARHEDHKFGTGDPFKIPTDSVFVVGDNSQGYVTDSREFGPVPVRNLQARILAAVQVTPIT